MKKDSIILTPLIISRNLRVPITSTSVGNSSALARQLDTALLSVGFKASTNLLKYISGLHPTSANDTVHDIIETMKELVGDNIEHNSYFKEFPKNVPDTLEFWVSCIADALINPETAHKVSSTVYAGFVNLLDLPKYGTYQHTYEEMLVAHEEFIAAVKDRKTILHLGKSLSEEALDLYHSLAESNVPLSPEDIQTLRTLAEVCIKDTPPKEIPMRENRAVINAVRLGTRKLLIDTPTDILRLACALSDGDVTLENPTKFKSIPHSKRSALLKELDNLISKAPAKLSDVSQYSERWKRLAERIHPHNYERYKYALDVFAVAYGKKKAPSIISRFEAAIQERDIAVATAIISNAPGILARNLDRLLLASSTNKSKQDTIALKDAVDSSKTKISGRVLLSLSEHLSNRVNKTANKTRVFANRKGTVYTTEEHRTPLSKEIVAPFLGILLNEATNRFSPKSILIDKTAYDIALPLSNKHTSKGFRIMPRGSVSHVDGDTLRFFCYWKQKRQRTDYDLSVILLDDHFKMVNQVSWTNLKGSGMVHSGDITDAPNGATEFIDIKLESLNKDCKYIVPQIYVYSGEDFIQTEESFFGFMERTDAQKGKPFEPATVHMKSDVRGNGRVALPLVFMRSDEGWSAKWINLYSKGRPNFNRVESQHVTTSLLIEAMVNRQYITVGKLIGLLKVRGVSVEYYDKNLSQKADMFIGIEIPEGLPENMRTITLSNLHELIPE